MKDWEEVTRARRLNMLSRVAFPIKSITPIHVLDVLKTAYSKNGPSVAADAKRTMFGIFEFAVPTLRAMALT